MENLFKSTTLSCKLTKEDIELINDNYEVLTGGTDELSGHALIMACVEKGISKKAPVTKPDPKDKEEIERLNSLVEMQLQTIKDKEAEISNLTDNLDEQSKVAERLLNSPKIEFKEVERVLGDKEIILNCEPFQKALLIKITELENERLKHKLQKPLTPGWVLFTMLTLYSTKGPTDFFPYSRYKNEVREILNAYKPANLS